MLNILHRIEFGQLSSATECGEKFNRASMSRVSPPRHDATTLVLGELFFDWTH